MTHVEKQIGGNIYACHITGKGEPLVLLHGFTGTSATWEPFIYKWASAFQVITIDLPGHGKSKTPNFPTMTEFCDDLKELLQQLQITKTHLLGYSLGGRAALSFAQRHPECVHSLILESASPGLKTNMERLQRRNQDGLLANKLLEQGIEVFVDEWERIPLFHSQKSLSDHQRKMIRNERLHQTASGLSQSLRQMGTGSQPSWWKRLSSLKMPVLLIVGGLDSKFIDINQEMEVLTNHSELIIVHDAGHAVHIEQPEKFATIVLEFLYLKNL